MGRCFPCEVTNSGCRGGSFLGHTVARASLQNAGAATATPSSPPARPIRAPAAKELRPGTPRRDSGQRASGAWEAAEREARRAAGGFVSKLLLLLPVQPSAPHPPPLLALQIRGFPQSPRSGGAGSEGGGRTAAGRSAAPSPPAAAAAALEQPRRRRGVRRAPARLGEERSFGVQLGKEEGSVLVCVRPRVWGRQSRNRAKASAEDPGRGPLGAFSGFAGCSRGGASARAPLAMDLCGVGTRPGRGARVDARPWGCAGARAGMAR